MTRTGDGEVTLYLDGNLNAKAKVGNRGPQSERLVTDNRALGVEALLLTGNSHPLFDPSRFEGCIDELYFFGDALNEAEIQKLSKLD